MKDILMSWVCWVGLVAIGVVGGLPHLPYYQDWMPYGYALGGMALVVLYLSFGIGVLGMYGLLAGAMRWGGTISQNRKVLRIGYTSIILASVFAWCYWKLMDITLKLS